MAYLDNRSDALRLLRDWGIPLDCPRAVPDPTGAGKWLVVDEQAQVALVVNTKLGVVQWTGFAHALAAVNVLESSYARRATEACWQE